MPKLSYSFLLLCASALPAGAVSLPAGGFFTDFSSKPGSGDFSTRTVSGAAADILTESALDARIQTLAASSINSALADASTPPTASGTGLYSAADERILTMPTGVRASVLMATITNDTGADLTGVTVSYDFDKIVSTGNEQVDGLRFYYSLTGAVDEWTALGTFGAPGNVSIPVSFSVATGSTFYFLWADDNGAGSPDDPLSVDNFSVTPVFASVPEPSGVVLSALALGGLAGGHRRRK